jgi:hypothetical protein
LESWVTIIKKGIVVSEYVETYPLAEELFSGGERLIYGFD